LQQPSVFSEIDDIRRCAELIRTSLAEAGFQSPKLVDTGRSPIVFGEYNCGAPSTLLVYTYFDTMPVDLPEKWILPPYSGAIAENLNGFRRCMVGEGASSKGSTMAFINAMEAWIETNTLPVNILFVSEGEEMWGSVHIPWFIEKERHKLLQAKALFTPIFSQGTNGQVASLSLGGKGFVGFELECSGKSWGKGPIGSDAHSSSRAIVDSPMWRLVHAITTMTEKDGNRILINGFYDGIAGPDSEEEKLLDELTRDFDEEDMKRKLSVTRFVDDIHGKDVISRNLYSSTLNFEGIPPTSVDPVGVVSSVAKAKFQSRLVRNQSPDGLLRKIREHLDKQGYSDIKINRLYGFGPGRTSANEPIVQALLTAYRDHGLNRPRIWPSNPASSPTNAFNNLLGIPVGVGGLGMAGKSGVTQYLVLEGKDKVGGLLEAEQSFIEIIENYAHILNQ
jgi:acetylornithine deacetylase/succinyl-diaminopimelate desuccinylase-like protein